MKPIRSFMVPGLVGLICLIGCRGLPEATEQSKQTPIRPIATPTAITAAYVKRDNAHEISQALNDEIEWDLRGQAVYPPATTPKKAN